MFELDQFIADCREANKGSEAHKAVQDVVERSVADTGALMKGIGEPERAGVQTLHHDSELTVLNVIWGPHMTIMPHNHEMWAVIGVYTGREDNIFWRRLPEHGDGRIRAAGAKELCAGDVIPLGRDIIHTVTNPVPRLTGAIHVYGGDFFVAPRSEWDPETLVEGTYDVDKTMRMFEESNVRLPAA